MIFGDGVGASLVRGPFCQLDVGLCEVDVFLHWNSAAEEGAWVGLKPDLQGGTGFNLLRVHSRSGPRPGRDPRISQVTNVHDRGGCYEQVGSTNGGIAFLFVLVSSCNVQLLETTFSN